MGVGLGPAMGCWLGPPSHEISSSPESRIFFNSLVRTTGNDMTKVAFLDVWSGRYRR